MKLEQRPRQTKGLPASTLPTAWCQKASPSCRKRPLAAEGLSIATGITAHVTATAQLAIAIYNLDQAVQARKDAEDGHLNGAREQEAGAIA